MKSIVCVSLLLTMLTLPAQQVRFDGGDVLAGTVADVRGNRARVRCADGSSRELPVRQVECEIAADGTVRRFHAEPLGDALDDAGRALLDRIARGAEVPFPELYAATDRCSTALLDGLRQCLADKKAAVRQAAALALVLSSVPDAVHAALAAAVDDASGKLLMAIAPALCSGARLGALEAADAGELVARGFAAKDAATRFSMAWIGVHLEVDGAKAALAKFLADSDHHRRESAAVALAEHGDAAGVAIVLTMAKRDRAPVQTANSNADAETKALVDRLALRERCHACELLGELRHEPALPVLERLAAAKNADLAAAARAAVQAIRGG